MRMMVRCGNEECENVFYVESKDPVWECTNCGREILNRNYPFLTAKLMQGKIDGDKADWRALFLELVERAEIEISSRGGREREGLDLSFLRTARELVDKRTDMDNSEWRREHDTLLERSREVVLLLDEK
jgi:hypothetical protein